MTDTPRTPEQVRFVPNLPWEQVAAMWRQSVTDSRQTMSYAERAKEVLACVVTAADQQLDEATKANLAFIGVLLVLWEGSIMLMESRCAELEGVVEARGGLLDAARAEIERLRALIPTTPTRTEP